MKHKIRFNPRSLSRLPEWQLDSGKGNFPAEVAP
jgi:hypothetical protein